MNLQKYTIQIYICLICLSFLFVTCSSLPDHKGQFEMNEIKNKASTLTRQGNNYYRDGKYTLALQFYREALKTNRLVDHLQGMAQSHLDIGKVLLFNENTDEAIEYFNSALLLTEENNLTEIKTWAVFYLGQAKQKQGELKSALSYYNQAYEFSQIDRQDELAAIILLKLHSLDQINIDKLIQAVSLLEGLYNSKKLTDAKRLSTAYYTLSKAYFQKPDYDKAIKFASLALKIDKDLENSIGIGQDLHALGEYYYHRQENNQALNYLNRSKFIYVYLSRKNNLVQVLNKLIEIYRESGDDENIYYSMVDLFLITVESYKTNDGLKQDLISQLEELIVLAEKLGKTRQRQILNDHLDQVRVLQDNLLYQGLVKDDL